MPVPFRISVPVYSDGDSGSASGKLEDLTILGSRQADGPEPTPSPTGSRDNDDSRSTLIIVVVVVIGILVFLFGGFVFIKRRAESRRRRQGPVGLEPYSSGAPPTQDTGRGAGPVSRSGTARNGVSGTNRNSAASTIDRNTSIRSIITLPVYNDTAIEGEQVLGRAGERDGIDVIVEMPTAEQHEALRNEEMDATYQIRMTRRQQNAEREERQRLTREARERGDTAALHELRMQRRAENDDTTIQELRDIQTRARVHRERAVSSVSYHNVGMARHDGSRVRANSSESERVGLLAEAASIAVSTRSPSAMSGRRVSDVGSITPYDGHSMMTAGSSIRSPSALSQHRRMRSTSSVLSLNDNNDDASPHSDDVGPGMTPRLGARSGSGNGSNGYGGAGSSPEIVTEADLGDMPPPMYEDLDLDDEHSGATTPMFIHEPPPDYAGHGLTGHNYSHVRNNSYGNDNSYNHNNSYNNSHRVDDNESGDLASPVDEDRSRRSSHRSSRTGAPQLPSLNIGELPRIVVEPSTAHPSESGR
ncbi:hypothetical protein F4777DRAFT_15938 [Nemania sp. FL0916]|nr:hypothetical protein F4777DRAFT_15938 [Nemania sp. FL0916]